MLEYVILYGKISIAMAALIMVLNSITYDTMVTVTEFLNNFSPPEGKEPFEVHNEMGTSPLHYVKSLLFWPIQLIFHLLLFIVFIILKFQGKL